MVPQPLRTFVSISAATTEPSPVAPVCVTLTQYWTPEVLSNGSVNSASNCEVDPAVKSPASGVRVPTTRPPIALPEYIVRVLPVVPAPTVSCSHARTTAFPLGFAVVSRAPVATSVSALVGTAIGAAGCCTSSPNNTTTTAQLSAAPIATTNSSSIVVFLHRDARLHRRNPARILELLIAEALHALAFRAEARYNAAFGDRRILIALVNTLHLHAVFIRRQWPANVRVGYAIGGGGAGGAAAAGARGGGGRTASRAA